MRFTEEIPTWAVDAYNANMKARADGLMPDEWFWVDEILLVSGYRYE